MESPPLEPLGKPPAQYQRGLHLLRVSRDGSRLRPAGPRCSTAPATASHPPPRFGTGSQPGQHLEGQSCPRPCVSAARLSSLPFPARPGPPAPVPVPRWAAGAVRAGPGRAGARGRCWLLSSLECPRVAGEVAGAEWGRRNESRASPYFSPAPLFLSQHFRTIPPTRSLLPPPLVAGAGLSPSPCLRLPRPFSAPPSPLGSRRAGRQLSPSPPRGACPCMRVPQPSPSCLRQPGVLVLCRGGKERRLSARRCILQSLPCLSSGVNVCARGNLCNHGFLQKGEGVGERSASSALSPSRRSPLIP